MRKTENKILPFPQPKLQLTTQTIVCHIGSERFAIHIEIEDLPPVTTPLLLVKSPLQKRKHH